MGLLTSATPTLFTGTFTPAAKLLGVNPARNQLVISCFPQPSGLSIWIDSPGATQGGIIISQQLSQLHITRHEYGQMVMQEWWAFSFGFGNVNIAVIETFDITDFGGKADATRKQYSSNSDRSDGSVIPTGKRRPNRDTDSLIEHGTLYDYILRCRRFRSGN